MKTRYGPSHGSLRISYVSPNPRLPALVMQTTLDIPCRQLRKLTLPVIFSSRLHRLPRNSGGCAGECGHGSVRSPLRGDAFRSIAACTNHHFQKSVAGNSSSQGIEATCGFDVSFALPPSQPHQTSKRFSLSGKPPAVEERTGSDHDCGGLLAGGVMDAARLELARAIGSPTIPFGVVGTVHR